MKWRWLFAGVGCFLLGFVGSEFAALPHLMKKPPRPQRAFLLDLKRSPRWNATGEDSGLFERESILIKWFEEMAAEDYPFAFEEIVNGLSGETRETAITLLAMAWVQVNPEQMMRVMAPPGEDDWVYLLYPVWASRDPEEAFEHAIKNDHHLQAHDLFLHLTLEQIERLLPRLEQRSMGPETTSAVAAIAYRYPEWFFDQLPKSDFLTRVSSWGFASAFRSLMSKDSQAALAQLSEFQNHPELGPDLAGVISMLATHLAISDPQSASQWIESLEDGRIKRLALRRSASNLIHSSPETIKNWVAESDTPIALMSAALGPLHGHELKQALTSLHELMPDVTGRDRVLANLAKHEDRTADAKLQLVAKIENPDKRAKTILTLTKENRSLVKNTPKFLALMPEGEALDTALEHYSAQLAESSKETLLGALPEIPDKWRPQILPELARRLARLEPEMAVAMLDEILPDLHGEILTNAAATWANQDPQAALETLHAFPAEITGGALSRVVGHWADNDPYQAADYLATDETPGLHAEVASSWASYDPFAASDWIAHLPQGASREAAIGAFQTQVSNEDLALTDEERQQLLESLTP